MLVAQFSTVDISGGAARAAYRLHRALGEAGCHSLLCCAQKKLARDATVIKVQTRKDTLCTTQQAVYETLRTVLQVQRINGNRTDLSQTLFSLGYPGLDPTDLRLVQQARIIHLHWINYFLSPESVRRLGDVRAPIVWTLHDQWPMTGGCHYDAGCGGYERDCACCPQLVDNSLGLPAAVLADKLAMWRGLNITVVTPSRWMADCARRSRVFRNHRIEVIPNGLETDVFRPLDRRACRERLGLPNDGRILAFGAQTLANRRKGLGILIEALRRAEGDPRWPDRVLLLLFGEAEIDLSELNMPILNCGAVSEDRRLAEIINAADAIILPSIEDNYPNVMIEAMSCGVPVVAFDVGGMKDAIRDGVTGTLVSPVGDVDALKDALCRLLQSPERTSAWGDAARRVIGQSHSLTAFAARMIELYEDLNPGFRDPLPEDVCLHLDAIAARQDPHVPFLCTPLHQVGPGFERPDLIEIMADIIDEQRLRLKREAEEKMEAERRCGENVLQVACAP